MSFVTRTLRALPFGRIIGGPMTAAIEAQALAAQSTVNFIKSVGFDTPANPAAGELGSVRNVEFTYQRKKITPTGTTGTANDDEETVTLTVPILTIVPIPYIRIESLTIDFTANITEQHEDSVSFNNTTVAETSINGKYGNFLSPVNVQFAAKFSTKSSLSTASKNKTSVEATIDINLKAVQDEMPAGLAKVLTILETAIFEKPKP